MYSKIKKFISEHKIECAIIAGLTVATTAIGCCAIKYMKKSDPSQSNKAEGTIHINKLFEYIVGVPEEEFKNNPELRKNCFIKKDDGLFYIKNCKTGQEFCAGSAEQCSLAYLRDRTHIVGKSLNSGTFSIEQGNVIAHQAKTSGRLCPTYQGASGFDALERVGENQSVFEGVNRLITDNTQGPNLALSAFAGLLLREYYIFARGVLYKNGMLYEPVSSNPEAWRQTDNNDQQINLLERVPAYYPTHNGNVNFTGTVDKHADKEFLKQNIGVLLHKNAQVTVTKRNGRHGNSSDTVVVQNDPACQTHQVYVSTIDLNNRNNRKVYQDPATQAEVIKRAQACQEAAIEGTLRAALLARSRKVVLTPIGCGVFGNDPQWFVDAVLKCEKLIRDSGLDVTLLIFNPANDQKIVEGLNPLAARTGGQQLTI